MAQRTTDRRSAIITILGCIMISIAGCAGGGGSISPASTPTGNVSGYVYAPVGGAGRAAGAPTGYQPLQGATVYCDGISDTTDTDGYYLLEGVPTGPNKTVRITKTGYGTITKTGLSVTAGQTTVATPENSTDYIMTLTSSGSISVSSTPASATIYIDSILTGLTTPHTFEGISPGNHDVYVFLSGYVLPATQTVSVSTGETSSVSFTLSSNLASLYADDDAYLGLLSAPVTIVEFSDYQCPYCKRFSINTLPEIQENYIDTGEVRYVYRDLPLSFHTNAKKAAEAAECAGEQNKYWEMHDKLFEEGVAGGVDSYKQYAADLGLKIDEFNNCLDSGAMTGEVDNDIADAQELGISGTPTFLINDDRIVGAQPYENFESVIESNLE